MSSAFFADNGILLVGLMAAGKTTLGEMLADTLAWPFMDNDELVRLASGLSRDPLLKAEGLAAIRAAERAALSLMVAAPKPIVGATAAGVITDAEARAELKSSGCLIVWVHASPVVLAHRVGDGGDRPSLRPSPLAAFEKMHSERSAYYAEVAHVVIDTSELSMSDAVSKVTRSL